MFSEKEHDLLKRASIYHSNQVLINHMLISFLNSCVNM